MGKGAKQRDEIVRDREGGAKQREKRVRESEGGAKQIEERVREGAWSLFQLRWWGGREGYLSIRYYVSSTV
jgi:hypothetical protein